MNAIEFFIIAQFADSISIYPEDTAVTSTDITGHSTLNKTNNDDILNLNLVYFTFSCQQRKAERGQSQ